MSGVTGKPAAGARGAWKASGTASCGADGGLRVSFGDESAAVSVSCPPGPPDPPDPPLTIDEIEFSCPVPQVVAGIPTPCTFNLSGSGADEATGTIAGSGGVDNVNGDPTADASGAWSVSGLATCTADGGLEVSFGDETASTDVGCPSGASEPLAVETAGFECTPQQPPLPALCNYVLAGSGADTVNGTVAGDGTNVNVPLPVPAVAVAGGTWTASGAAICSADGKLTVTFGAESVDVPVSCAGGGGEDNGALAVTTNQVSCTPPAPALPGVCTVTLAGGGADTTTGTVTGDGAGVTTDIPVLAAGAPDGSWTAVGTALCTADGSLAVTFGTETAPVNVDCPDPVGGGGGGGGNGALTVSTSQVNCVPQVSPLPGICSVVLAGAGADTTNGTVTGDGGGVTTPVPVPALAEPSGSWTATGAATCTADGTLTVTFGNETATANVDCPDPIPGGGGGGGRWSAHPDNQSGQLHPAGAGAAGSLHRDAGRERRRHHERHRHPGRWRRDPGPGRSGRRAERRLDGGRQRALHRGRNPDRRLRWREQGRERRLPVGRPRVRSAHQFGESEMSIGAGRARRE